MRSPHPSPVTTPYNTRTYVERHYRRQTTQEHNLEAVLFEQPIHNRKALVAPHEGLNDAAEDCAPEKEREGGTYDGVVANFVRDTLPEVPSTCCIAISGVLVKL